jgi:AcrR family transcriptional regulator
MPSSTAETRERVLAAASDLFATHGFHGTKMRDIAARAKVNLAAANYHFGSKEDLYLDVLREQFARINEVLVERGAILRDGLDRDQLVRLLRERVAAMLELLLGPPPGLHGTLMMREMLDPSEALPVIVDQFVAPHRDAMQEIVARLAPELEREAVERCVFSIVGQVFFYRTHLPVFLHLEGLQHISADLVRTAADHITAFSLGGMAQIAAAPSRTRRLRRKG